MAASVGSSPAGATIVSEGEKIRLSAAVAAAAERLDLPELAESTVSATNEIASMAETP
jgi:hypothetical protein